MLNCTKPGERNLQCAGSSIVGAEGRLTLNICRPNTTEEGLPVMVYFHGGNFQIGQAEEWLGSQLLFYIGKFMKYGRLDSAIGPDEAPWPAWKPELQQEMFFDGDRQRGYVKTGWNEFCFEDVFARFKADTSVSEESKDFIASRVFNHRIFSREWDTRYGNPPDPMLIRP